jgi:hypothetical protein
VLRRTEGRSEAEITRPVFLLLDEAQNYVTASKELGDALYLAESRKNKPINIYMSQSIEAAEQAAKAQAEREKQERQQAEAAAKPPAAPVSPTVSAERREQAPPQPKVTLAVRAYYLEKKPGGLMKNYGMSGELVFREDGIGFAFHEAQKLDGERQRAADGGTIFIPFEALGTGFVRDQKLLMGAAPKMFFVVLTPRQGTPAYERLRPLLTQDCELLFTVRALHERGRISSFFTRLNASNF